jgi:hypothetical protein
MRRWAPLANEADRIKSDPRTLMGNLACGG